MSEALASVATMSIYEDSAVSESPTLGVGRCTDVRVSDSVFIGEKK
ncbi:hypothetical protein C7S14_8401 [Burkholderia cepacia]|nr:hypothetical protein C7S14_8401 [Burkholderia cepacia]